jgi:hypothetical protein
VSTGGEEDFSWEVVDGLLGCGDDVVAGSGLLERVGRNNVGLATLVAGLLRSWLELFWFSIVVLAASVAEPLGGDTGTAVG